MNDFASPGQESDPGLLRGMADGTPLAQLRMTAVVGFGVAPVVIAVVGLVVIDTFAAFDPVALVPVAGGFLGTILAAVFPVRALPYDTPPQEAADISAARFRSHTMLRLALCETPLLFGFVAGFAFDSGVIPLMVGLAIAAVALPTLALPTRSAIERFRSRLEAEGARSHLWEGLRGRPVGNT